MLSSRGRRYAALDLASSYTKERGPLYSRAEHADGLVSLAQAENFLMQECTLGYIKTACMPSLESSALTYHDGPYGSKRLRQAMASFINTRFAPAAPVTMDHISFATGVTALNEVLSVCMTDGGNDALLLGMPIYGSFAPDMQSTSGCRLVYAPFGDVDQFSVNAVDCYERALQEAKQNGITVRALVLANPHNPLGQCYTPEVLEALLRFCSRHDIHLISDEIYACSAYDTGSTLPGFTSVLSIDAAGLIDSNLVHVLYGMSKDFAAAGLRLGCLISKNEALTTAARSLARFHWTSPLTDAIATTMLEDKEWQTQFLEESARALGEYRRIATEALDGAGIPYNRKANAGFFLWIDLSACLQSSTWQAEDDLKEKLYDYGVEMSAGRAYHDEKPGKFRFIFSVDKDTLVEGLGRVAAFYKSNRSNQA